MENVLARFTTAYWFSARTIRALADCCCFRKPCSPIHALQKTERYSRKTETLIWWAHSTMESISCNCDIEMLTMKTMPGPTDPSKPFLLKLFLLEPMLCNTPTFTTRETSLPPRYTLSHTTHFMSPACVSHPHWTTHMTTLTHPHGRHILWAWAHLVYCTRTHNTTNTKWPLSLSPLPCVSYPH